MLWGCLSGDMSDSGDRPVPELSCETTQYLTALTVSMETLRAWDDIGVVVGQYDSENDIIVGLSQQPKSMNYSATLLISEYSCDQFYFDSYWLAKDNNYYLLP